MPDFSNCKKVYFEDLVLKVHSDVYEPAEDSFLLARHVPKFAEGDVLDMGTGSGIQALVAAGEESSVLGVDINRLAVENARFNAEQNGRECEFLEGDLFNELDDSQFDLIIFNPPYLPTGEGEKVAGAIDAAWNGGEGGREIIDRFLAGAPDFLKKGGVALTLASSLSGINETLAALKGKGMKPQVLEEISLFQEKLAVIAAKKQ
ncbi:putative S-adenosylmethionine-dependent methyltransferase [Candidatus Burarchaeum australiense]|nr:putative S-adenosylmethionine-dependent methyltransferase [Candidatus Burarchaeum australiense]